MAWSKEQLYVAKTIADVGRSLGASQRDILIALMAGFQESGLRNLSWGDRDSIGVFQQRNGWGSHAQRMNVKESARMFFQGGHQNQRGLLDFNNRETMSLSAAAQAVQVSAFPKAYAKWENDANKIMGEVGNFNDLASLGGTEDDLPVDSSLMPSNGETNMLADLGELRSVDIQSGTPGVAAPTTSQLGGTPMGLEAGIAPGVESADRRPFSALQDNDTDDDMADLLKDIPTTTTGSSGGVAAGGGTGNETMKALQFAAREAKTGSAQWYQWCLKFVRTASGIAPGARSAIDAWMQAKDRHANGAPPAGAAVFWRVGRFGHVALSAGDGYVYSTDILRKGKVDRVPISMISKKWGAAYLGWTGDLNGSSLQLG